MSFIRMTFFPPLNWKTLWHSPFQEVSCESGLQMATTWLDSGQTGTQFGPHEGYRCLTAIPGMGAELLWALPKTVAD